MQSSCVINVCDLFYKLCTQHDRELGNIDVSTTYLKEYSAFMFANIINVLKFTKNVCEIRIFKKRKNFSRYKKHQNVGEI